MSNSFCTECGNKVDPGAKFCGGCGAPQAAAIGAPPALPVDVAPATQAAFVGSPLQPQPQQQPPPHTSIHNTVVMVGGTKSVGVALLLSFFFGPLGLFYATVTGGVVMLIVSFVVALFTFGLGLFITWPICVVWSAIAASNHNTALMQSQQPRTT